MVLSLWVLACAPKHAAVMASTPLVTDVVVVQDQYDQRSVVAGPPELLQDLTTLLQGHALQARSLPSEQVLPNFAGRRTDAQRLAWMAERPGVAPALLLVDTRAEFYSQMNGRYRWTVEVSASLRSTAQAEALATDAFSVPVFLDFDHEREEAAIIAAIPVIHHHLDRLVDDWLGGLNP